MLKCCQVVHLECDGDDILHVLVNPLKEILVRCTKNLQLHVSASPSSSPSWPGQYFNARLGKMQQYKEHGEYAVTSAALILDSASMMRGASQKCVDSMIVNRK